MGSQELTRTREDSLGTHKDRCTESGAGLEHGGSKAESNPTNTIRNGRPGALLSRFTITLIATYVVQRRRKIGRPVRASEPMWVGQAAWAGGKEGAVRCQPTTFPREPWGTY